MACYRVKPYVTFTNMNNINIFMNLVLLANPLSETTCHHILSPKMMDKSTAEGSVFVPVYPTGFPDMGLKYKHLHCKCL